MSQGKFDLCPQFPLEKTSQVALGDACTRTSVHCFLYLMKKTQLLTQCSGTIESWTPFVGK